MPLSCFSEISSGLTYLVCCNILGRFCGSAALKAEPLFHRFVIECEEVKTYCSYQLLVADGS